MKMKNLMIASLIVCLTALEARAQDNPTDFRELMTGGIKAGANYSNVYDAQGDAFQANPKAGFAIGGFLSIPLGRYFGVQPELLYSQRGMQASGKLFGSTYNLSR